MPNHYRERDEDRGSETHATSVEAPSFQPQTVLGTLAPPFLSPMGRGVSS